MGGPGTGYSAPPECPELNSAPGMLGTMTMALAIDAGGPISDTVWAEVTVVGVLNPWVFTGLLFGAMVPYAVAAVVMESVGKAANGMVKECLE